MNMQRQFPMDIVAAEVFRRRLTEDDLKVLHLPTRVTDSLGGFQRMQRPFNFLIIGSQPEQEWIIRTRWSSDGGDSFLNLDLTPFTLGLGVPPGEILTISTTQSFDARGRRVFRLELIRWQEAFRIKIVPKLLPLVGPRISSPKIYERKEWPEGFEVMCRGLTLVDIADGLRLPALWHTRTSTTVMLLATDGERVRFVHLEIEIGNPFWVLDWGTMIANRDVRTDDLVDLHASKISAEAAKVLKEASPLSNPTEDMCTVSVTTSSPAGMKHLVSITLLRVDGEDWHVLPMFVVPQIDGRVVWQSKSLFRVQAEYDWIQRTSRQRSGPLSDKVWIAILVFNFVLETAASILDVYSERSLEAAMVCMIFSLVGLLISVFEVFYQVIHSKLRFERRGVVPWWYHTSGARERYGSVGDYIGWACAISQFIIASVNYSLVARGKKPFEIPIPSILLSLSFVLPKIKEYRGRLLPFAPRFVVPFFMFDIYFLRFLFS